MSQRRITFIPPDIPGNNGKTWGLALYLLENVVGGPACLSSQEGCDLSLALAPQLERVVSGEANTALLSEQQWQLLVKLAPPPTNIHYSIAVPLAAHMRQLYVAEVVP